MSTTPNNAPADGEYVPSTSGPWEVYDQSADEGWDSYVGHVRSTTDSNADWVAQTIHNPADARLIAAAPTIVALLRRMAEADPMGHDSKENYRCNFCGSEDVRWGDDEDTYVHEASCVWMETVTLLAMSQRDGHVYLSDFGKGDGSNG